MTSDQIAEVGIDPRGSLFVRPARESFPLIYRAAMEVGWDEGRGRLFGPPPRELSYGQWFQQIVVAAADEYGVRLRLEPTTIWTGVSAERRAEIEAASCG